MFRLPLTTAAVVFFLLTHAQGHEIDSLKNVLKHAAVHDSDRIKTLLSLAYAVTNETPDSAMHYSNEALKLSEKISWQKGVALSCRQKGLVHYALTDNVKALDWFQQALKANESDGNKLFEASVFNNIGNIYADLSQFDKALTSYNRLLASARAAGNKSNEVIAVTNIGSVYLQLNDFPKALDCFERSLLLVREEGNKNFEGTIANNIGRLYDKWGNYPKAIAYYNRSLRIADESHNKNIKATALNNLGGIYLNQQAYDKAEGYSRQSLKIAREIGTIDWQANAWETLSEIYTKQGKYGKALAAYKNNITLRDSVINAENKSEITRKEMQYGFNQMQDSTKAANDKQQALAAAEIRQQKTIRNSILSGAGLVMLSAVLLFFSYKRRRDANARRKDAELKAHIADTEMKVMRLQMNPHFIFNSLNSISDYIHKNNPHEADAYLSKFAKVMRMTLENSEQQAISLEDDLRTLELYMQLEAKRLNHKFTYEINVAPDIDRENTLVPPMIFQPFVENSIWHGIANKKGQGHIAIIISKDGEMLRCLIDDDGVGRQAATAEQPVIERQSLGMKITKARIDILNKLKGSAASVQLIDKPQGFSAQLKLPLETAF